VTMSSPEFAILKVCVAQLGRFLDLPTRMPGMLRDAKILDGQAGFETGMVGLSGALAADLLDWMGK
jgi:trimethylamine--corrinoid protein Co-methyltransferase